jgi:chemotaxis protein MotA
MFGIIGIVTIFVMVFGGYMLAGGKMDIILKALPFEMIMIGGAAVGAFLIANDMATLRQTLRDLGKVFRGPHWKPADYRDLLCLLFELIRIARENPVALEEHIENPESTVFGRYPAILKDHEAVDLICDTLRAASMNYDDPHQVEEVLEKRHGGGRATTPCIPATRCRPWPTRCPRWDRGRRAGGDQDHGVDRPAARGAGQDDRRRAGRHLSGRVPGLWHRRALRQPRPAMVEEDAHFYQLIREVLVANLHSHSANICIEVGRQNTPHHLRPSFPALEAALRDLRQTTS